MIEIGSILYLLLTGLLWLGALGAAVRWAPGGRTGALTWSLVLLYAWHVAEAQALATGWRGYGFASIVALDAIVGVTAALFFRREWLSFFRGNTKSTEEIEPLPRWAWAGVAAAALFSIASLATQFRNPIPGIDAVNYHFPVAVMLKQEGKLGYYEINCAHANEFPRNVPFVFARIFTYTNTEKLTPLVTFAAHWLAVFALYGWMRRWGVKRSVALVIAPLYWMMEPVLELQLSLSGNVDQVLHAMLIVLWGHVAAPERDPRAYAKLLLWAAFASGLAAGTKSTALMLGGGGMIVGLGRLAWLLWKSGAFSAAPIARVIATGLLSFLMLGSASYINNVRWYGNPVAPIEMDAFKDLAERSPYAADHLKYKTVHHLVGTKKHAGTSSNPKAVLRSWATSLGYKGYLTEEPLNRMGFWGVVWVPLLLPAWGLGMVVLARQRRWWELVVAMLFLLMLLRVPGSWWARFSVYQYAMALSLAAVAIGTVRRESLRRSFLLVTLLAGVVQGCAAFAVYFRKDAPKDPVPPAPGHAVHSLDLLEGGNYWELEGVIPAYRWCRDNLPADSVLVYFVTFRFGVYHYFFYRDDTANRVFHVLHVENEEEFTRILLERGATHFLVDARDPCAEWAPRHGKLILGSENTQLYRMLSKH